jgi:hypothetical protein
MADSAGVIKHKQELGVLADSWEKENSCDCTKHARHHATFTVRLMLLMTQPSG